MKNLYKILFLILFFVSCDENVVEAIHGCFDSEACNYNPNATYDNNSCEFESCADCTGIPFGESIIDDCGVCNGDDTYCLPVDLSFGNIFINDAQQIELEILINSPQNINGFQFYLNETEIMSAYGGVSEEYGFEVIVDPNGQSPDLIIGFSFTGNIIPSQTSGILTNLILNTLSTQVCFNTENSFFTKSVDPSIELDNVYDELDGTDDDVIQYQVTFGNCINIPTLN